MNTTNNYSPIMLLILAIFGIMSMFIMFLDFTSNNDVETYQEI